MTTRQEITVAKGSPGHASVSETTSHVSLMLLEVCVMPCCSIKSFFFSFSAPEWFSRPWGFQAVRELCQRPLVVDYVELAYVGANV